MTQSQMRQVYQAIYNAYNRMCEVREEDVEGLKDAKQFTMYALALITQELNGDL